jgi:hypothetical protein
MAALSSFTPVSTRATESLLETVESFISTAEACDLISSTPNDCRLVIYRGDTLAFRVEVTDATGNPVDVSGASWAAHIRRTYEEPDVLAELTMVPVAAQPSMIDVFLSAAQSAQLPPGTWRWDLEMTLGGIVQTLIAGAVEVTGDVTRDQGQ